MPAINENLKHDQSIATSLARAFGASQIVVLAMIAAIVSEREQHLRIFRQHNWIGFQICAVRTDALAGSQIERPIVQRTDNRCASQQSVSERAVAMRTHGLRRVDLTGVGPKYRNLLTFNDEVSPFTWRNLVDGSNHDGFCHFTPLAL
jgi:hypothetical protein